MDVRESRPWPIAWTALGLGGMAAVVASALFGFIATGIGAWVVAETGNVTRWNGTGLFGLAMAVIAAFFAFVIGGWIAGRIAGLRDAATAALYGAMTAVVGIFLMLALASFGATWLSGFYAGLAPAPIGTPAVPGTPVDPTVAAAARDAALAAATAILLAVVGGVIGGWVASEEPMSVGRSVPRVRIETERRAR